MIKVTLRPDGNAGTAVLWCVAGEPPVEVQRYTREDETFNARNMAQAYRLGMEKGMELLIHTMPRLID